MYHYLRQAVWLIMGLMTLSSMLGCATASHPDPLESLNRPVFQFNEALDRRSLKPAAQVYEDYLPNQLRRSINNFFNNLSMPYSAINNILQLQFANAGRDMGRFFINSIIGIFGLFDVAGDNLKIYSTYEDFGQTFAVWGVGNGPYLMLPFYGPTTLRDLIVKLTVAPYFSIDILKNKFTGQGRGVYAMYAFHAIRKRASYLQAEEMSKGLVFDKYLFYRGAYLSNRISAVYNGQPPMPDSEEDDAWLDDE